MKILAMLAVLMLAACGRGEPPSLLGEWKEDVNVPKYQRYKQASGGSEMKERTVHVFPDGTGVIQSVYTESVRRESFRWTLSADGRSLKTETPSDSLRVGGQNLEISGGPYVAKIVVLSQTELRIDEPSEANGRFQRVR